MISPPYTHETFSSSSFSPTSLPLPIHSAPIPILLHLKFRGALFLFFHYLQTSWRNAISPNIVGPSSRPGTSSAPKSSVAAVRNSRSRFGSRSVRRTWPSDVEFRLGMAESALVVAWPAPPRVTMRPALSRARYVLLLSSFFGYLSFPRGLGKLCDKILWRFSCIHLNSPFVFMMRSSTWNFFHRPVAMGPTPPTRPHYYTQPHYETVTREELKEP